MGSLKKVLKTVLFAGIAVVALFLLWPILKPLIKLLCKCILIPFKCCRSIGKHRKTLRKERKQRKNEAKKHAMEEKKRKQKARKEGAKASYLANWGRSSGGKQSSDRGNEGTVSSSGAAASERDTESNRWKESNDGENRSNSSNYDVNNEESSLSSSKRSQE